MPSNWKLFWFYPVPSISLLLVRAWHGRLQAIEIEFYIFSIGWIVIFLISICLDRLFSRVSTTEIDREKDLIRQFIRGKGDDTRQLGNTHE